MKDIGYVSEAKVMKSAAGWYIGTTFHHTEGDFKGFVEPNERFTEYFSSREAAQETLDRFEW